MSAHLMKNFMRFFWGLAFLSCISGGASALDEIVLNGSVRLVDMKEQLIHIDVRSADCTRQKTFRVSEKDLARVGTLQVGQEIRFATDRFKCSDNKSISAFIPDVPGGKK